MRASRRPPSLHNFSRPLLNTSPVEGVEMEDKVASLQPLPQHPVVPPLDVTQYVSPEEVTSPRWKPTVPDQVSGVARRTGWRFRAWIYTAPFRLTIGVGYLVFNLWLFSVGFTYEFRKYHSDIRQYTSPVGRGCGVMVGVNSVLIVLPMCRYLLTAIRETMPQRIGRLLDSSFLAHWWIGMVTFIGGMIHGIGQGVNYQQVYTFTGGLTGSSQVFVTGIFLAVIFLAMVFTAREAARNAAYQRFWGVHRLHWLYLPVLYLHALRAENRPSYAHLLVVAQWLLLLDKILRRLSIRKGKAIAVSQYERDLQQGDRFAFLKLTIQVHTFHYKPGQFAEIRVPRLSPQWHPFTISSAPAESSTNVEFTIKICGYWTALIYSMLVEGDEVDVIGPFGAPAEDAYTFDRAVFIASGVGATPFSSLLRDIHGRRSAGFKDRKRRLEGAVEDKSTVGHVRHRFSPLDPRRAEEAFGASRLAVRWFNGLRDPVCQVVVLWFLMLLSTAHLSVAYDSYSDVLSDYDTCQTSPRTLVLFRVLFGCLVFALLICLATTLVVVAVKGRHGCQYRTYGFETAFLTIPAGILLAMFSVLLAFPCDLYFPAAHLVILLLTVTLIGACGWRLYETLHGAFGYIAPVNHNSLYVLPRSPVSFVWICSKKRDTQWLFDSLTSDKVLQLDDNNENADLKPETEGAPVKDLLSSSQFRFVFFLSHGKDDLPQQDNFVFPKYTARSADAPNRLVEELADLYRGDLVGVFFCGPSELERRLRTAFMNHKDPAGTSFVLKAEHF